MPKNSFNIGFSYIMGNWLNIIIGKPLSAAGCPHINGHNFWKAPPIAPIFWGFVRRHCPNISAEFSRDWIRLTQVPRANNKKFSTFHCINIIFTSRVLLTRTSYIVQRIFDIWGVKLYFFCTLSCIDPDFVYNTM